MVCSNRPNPDEPGSPDHPLSPKAIAQLHQIRREALAHEGVLRQMIAGGLPADAVPELSQRLVSIKTRAGRLLAGSDVQV